MNDSSRQQINDCAPILRVAGSRSETARRGWRLSEPSRSDEDKRSGGVEKLSRRREVLQRRRMANADGAVVGRRVIAINYSAVISVMARVTVSERSARRPLASAALPARRAAAPIRRAPPPGWRLRGGEG